LRYYENLFIINPNIEQDRLAQLIEAVKAEITRLNGAVFNLEDWGKRRLAYQIKKHRYGTYILVQFESADAQIIRELEAWMRLNQSILAFITVVLEEKPVAKPVNEPVSEASA